ncbi:unnamed protein product [Caenorhabditis auriculariae]|uniref:Uncharacterized protein n=1 Tax=Caenorhabditis auriculariae TaxID=2777116 RepID=A0A8S1H8P3_9PELO|nr:unnamed protein product [Caenorhabditis auriculariae]
MFSFFKFLALATLFAVVFCEEKITPNDVIAHVLEVMKEVGVSEGSRREIEKIALPYKPKLQETIQRKDDSTSKAAFKEMRSKIDAYLATASKADQEAHKRFGARIKAEAGE